MAGLIVAKTKKDGAIAPWVATNPDDHSSATIDGVWAEGGTGEGVQQEASYGKTAYDGIAEGAIEEIGETGKFRFTFGDSGIGSVDSPFAANNENAFDDGTPGEDVKDNATKGKGAYDGIDGMSIEDSGTDGIKIKFGGSTWGDLVASGVKNSAVDKDHVGMGSYPDSPEGIVDDVFDDDRFTAVEGQNFDFSSRTGWSTSSGIGKQSVASSDDFSLLENNAGAKYGRNLGQFAYNTWFFSATPISVDNTETGKYRFTLRQKNIDVNGSVYAGIECYSATQTLGKIYFNNDGSLDISYGGSPSSNNTWQEKTWEITSQQLQNLRSGTTNFKLFFRLPHAASSGAEYIIIDTFKVEYNPHADLEEMDPISYGWAGQGKGAYDGLNEGIFEDDGTGKLKLKFPTDSDFGDITSPFAANNENAFDAGSVGEGVKDDATKGKGAYDGLKDGAFVDDGNGKWKLEFPDGSDFTDMTAPFASNIGSTGTNNFIASSNVSLVGTTARKTSTADGWDAQVYSKDGYTGGAYASATFPKAPNSGAGGGDTQWIAFGLSTDATDLGSYNDIEYCWYMRDSQDKFYIYENGSEKEDFGAWSTGDVFSVKYDGAYVKYFHNGEEKRSVAVAIAGKLFFDAHFWHKDSEISNMDFGPVADISKGKGAYDGLKDGAFVDDGNGKWKLEFPAASDFDDMTAPFASNIGSTGTNRFIASSGVSLVGTTARRTAAGSTWVQQVYSKDGFVGGAFASAAPGTALDNRRCMFGLNTDPTTDGSYETLDYAWYFRDGEARIYESGDAALTVGNYSVGDVFSVVYDGYQIKYLWNGTTERTVTVSIANKLFFDSSFKQPEAIITNMNFGPMSDTGVTRRKFDGTTSRLLKANATNNPTVAIGYGSVPPTDAQPGDMVELAGDIYHPSGLWRYTGIVSGDPQVSDFSGDIKWYNFELGQASYQSSWWGFRDATNNIHVGDGYSAGLELWPESADMIWDSGAASGVIKYTNTSWGPGGAYKIKKTGMICRSSEPGIEFRQPFYGTTRMHIDYMYTKRYGSGDSIYYSRSTVDAAASAAYLIVETSLDNGANWSQNLDTKFYSGTTSKGNQCQMEDGVEYGYAGGLYPSNWTHYKRHVRISVAQTGKYLCRIRSVNTGNDDRPIIHAIGLEGWVPAKDLETQAKVYELGTDASYNFMSFTGQHKCAAEDNSTPIEQGMIVSSTGEYDNFNYERGFVDDHSGVETSLRHRVNIKESVPVIKLTSNAKDKKVVGVYAGEWAKSKLKNKSFMGSGIDESLITRYEINSLGEGGIWVSDISGFLENGDYICSSDIPGYGMKQDDDILRNYTVAKITQDCYFDLESEDYDCKEVEHDGIVYKVAFVGCTYHCG